MAHFKALLGAEQNLLNVVVPVKPLQISNTGHDFIIEPRVLGSVRIDYQCLILTLRH